MARDLAEYSEQYTSDEHYGFECYQVKYRRKNILEQIRDGCYKNILEVGCGMEPLFQHVDMEDVGSYFVVEPAVAFYENALEINTDKRIVVLNDYIEHVDIDVKFDFVVISSLLHELEFPFLVLQAIKKFISSESVVYINVPNANSFHRLLAYEAKLIENIYSRSANQEKFQQFHVFDMASLCSLVQEQGYDVLNRGSYFIKPFSHSQMKSIIEAGIVNEEVLDGFNGMIKYCPEIGSELFLTCKLAKGE